MKSEHQQKVEQFIELAKNVPLPLPDKPKLASIGVRKLCARLILEEALETIRDGLRLDSFTLVEDAGKVNWYDIDDMAVIGEEKIGDDEKLALLADGCFDLHYVTTFAMSACGIPDSGQQLVDDNNLAKFGEGHRLAVDGKLIPPSGFEKAGPIIRRWIRTLM